MRQERTETAKVIHLIFVPYEILGLRNLIVVKLQGGLGNQMFQYAFGLSVSKRLNQPLYLDLSFFRNQEPYSDVAVRSLALNVFTDILPVASAQLTSSFLAPGLIQRTINRLGFCKKTVCRESSLKFSTRPLHQSPPVYFEGYWQSESYFFGMDDLIRAHLSLKKNLSPQSQLIANKLARQDNSVSVHIRRGDYMSSKRTNQIHGTCSLSYYNKAVALMQQKLSSPHFYFFSDEPDWVVSNLRAFQTNATIVSHNSGMDSWEDMALMSRCRHHIIANSSFSWWGAWLNTNIDKLVVAPKSWFKEKSAYFDDTDVVPAQWIKL